MAVKIRLARRGRKQSPFYHIVVADARSPRDGRFIEKIGIYNPMTSPATIDLDRDKAYEWLMNGAQPTNTARAILRFKGVMYKKHLQRGVRKEALTQEQADQMLNDWITEKEAQISERRVKEAKRSAERLARLSGNAPKLAEPVAEEIPSVDLPAAASSEEE